MSSTQLPLSGTGLLQSLRLRVTPIRPDGNCLFRALADQMRARNVLLDERSVTANEHQAVRTHIWQQYVAIVGRGAEDPELAALDTEVRAAHIDKHSSGVTDVPAFRQCLSVENTTGQLQTLEEYVRYLRDVPSSWGMDMDATTLARSLGVRICIVMRLSDVVVHLNPDAAGAPLALVYNGDHYDSTGPDRGAAAKEEHLRTLLARVHPSAATSPADLLAALGAAIATKLQETMEPCGHALTHADTQLASLHAILPLLRDQAIAAVSASASDPTPHLVSLVQFLAHAEECGVLFSRAADRFRREWHEIPSSVVPVTPSVLAVLRRVTTRLFMVLKWGATGEHNEDRICRAERKTVIRDDGLLRAFTERGGANWIVFDRFNDVDGASNVDSDVGTLCARIEVLLQAAGLSSPAKAPPPSESRQGGALHQRGARRSWSAAGS